MAANIPRPRAQTAPAYTYQEVSTPIMASPAHLPAGKYLCRRSSLPTIAALPDNNAMESVMQLYYSPGACSLASHIIALETGLPVELKRADTKTKKLEDGSDYFAVNSKGAVPALRLDNGQVLTEGPVIMQYLADQKGDTKLAPKAGTIERYRLLEWLNYITSEVHKSFSPLFNPAATDAVKAYTVQLLEKKFDWLNK